MKLNIYTTYFICLLLFVSCKSEDSVEPISGDPLEPTTISEFVSEYEILQQKSPKRGVSFSWQLNEDFDLLGPAVSWSYSWGNTPAASQAGKYQEYGIQFVPMCWNANYSAENISNYYRSQSGQQYLLGFNEPNLTDQANMTPQQAADKWGDVVSLAKQNNARLISPAMNWGTLSGWSNGVSWLQSFFKLVDPNDVHGIAVHIYMGAAKSMLGDLQRYKVFGKPLWLTEFCAWEGTSSSAAQCQFMSQAINALEQDPDLERYAWFIPRGGYETEKSPFMSLLTKGNPPQLTERGVLFVNMSSFDQNVVYSCGKRIPAEHYRACSVDDNYASVPIAVCTDEDGVLQIDGMSQNQTMDYKIKINSSAKYFQIRYSATRDSQIELYRMDGDTQKLIAVMNMPTTGSKTDWVTNEYKLPSLKSGEQVIRIRCSKGLPRINWFAIH